MDASLLKRLFTAIKRGDDSAVETLCEKIIAGEKKRGHGHLARELDSILQNSRRTADGATSSTPQLQPLPTARRDSAALVQVLPHERLRHRMVLAEEVEQRFIRVEKEFAARARLHTHGLEPRRRILLYGPPGCGKSLGAERLAWATGLPMHKVRFDTLISSYFGESAANLHRLFADAQQRPCALFLDECDTIARSRAEGNDVGEVPRIVNMLLQLLEDFRGDGLVIAATNLEHALDHAMFRRFDEVIEVPKPGRAEIERLLKLTLDALESEPGIVTSTLAAKLVGQPGSEVVKAARNAAKRSVLAGRKRVTRQDIEGAISELRRPD